MQRFNDRVTQDTGTAVRWVASPTVTVFDSGTANLSALFDDNVGTPKANPFIGDATGRVFFYAADGKYDVVYSGGTPACSDTVSAELLDDTLSLTASSPGITSLNAQVGAVQTLSTGTSGNDFAVSSAADVHTLNLPVASSTSTGKLLNTDWSDFFSRLKSLNGLTSVAQLLVIGSSGSSPNIVSLGNTHSINLPLASATRTGVLSNTDWQTFSSKQASIPLGTTSQYIRGDHTLQTLNTDNVPEGAGNLYYTNARARLALSATSPIQYSTATGVISSNQATAGQNGYLTAADFIIFSAKMGTLNGLSDVTQSFSTDSNGNDFAISSAAAYHTFKLPSASSTARGVVTTGPQFLNGPKTWMSEAYFQKYIELSNRTEDLTNAGTNQARIYLRYNGSKHELVVIFPTGARQVMATEP